MLPFLNIIGENFMKNVSTRRYVYLVLNFVILLLLGIAYAWSIFVGPLENAYGWTRMQTSLAFTILMVGFSGGSLLAGILAKKIGFSKISMIASLLVGGGLVATAFTSSISVLYVTYGVLAGLGIGMIYNTIVSVIPLWFPDKKGMVTGLLLMGYALSTSILSPICQWLLVSFGPKTTFLTFGILDFVVFLLGSFFMKEPNTAELVELPEIQTTIVDQEMKNYTTSEMLHSVKFYVYFLGANFLVMSALGYLNHVAPALQSEMGMSAVTAAYVVSAMSLCNGVARPLAGRMFDKFSIRFVLRVICLIYAVSASLAVFALNSHATWLLVVASCLLLFGYGFQGASLPCVIRRFYGNEYFSMNYSIVSLVSLTASFCPSFVGKMQVLSGSYSLGFAVMAVCCVASIPLMFIAGIEK